MNMWVFQVAGKLPWIYPYAVNHNAATDCQFLCLFSLSDTYNIYNKNIFNKNPTLPVAKNKHFQQTYFDKRNCRRRITLQPVLHLPADYQTNFKFFVTLSHLDPTFFHFHSLQKQQTLYLKLNFQISRSIIVM